VKQRYGVKDMTFRHGEDRFTRADMDLYQSETNPNATVLVLKNVEGTVSERDTVVETAATAAREDGNLKAEDIRLFEQKQDGSYDKVQFRTFGQSVDGRELWGEYDRVPYTKEQFQAVVGADHELGAPRDRGAEEAAHQAVQREQMNTGSLPVGVRNGNEAELAALQAGEDGRERVAGESLHEKQQPFRDMDAPSGFRPLPADGPHAMRNEPDQADQVPPEHQPTPAEHQPTPAEQAPPEPPPTPDPPTPDPQALVPVQEQEQDY